jgi:hypothetical protein
VVALAVVLTVIVVLLSILVAGLLRSHADILKALHDLGSGVGDPAGEERARRAAKRRPDHAPPPGPGRLLTVGPPLPGARGETRAPAVVGVTPGGDGLAIDPTQGADLTLLAFLSTGCGLCGRFWEVFRSSTPTLLPAGTRLVVVTKGPDHESISEIAAKARDVPDVVMSSEAWADYEVPGAPFFVLVDAAAGRRVGEGLASRLEQLTDLIRLSRNDEQTGARRLRRKGLLGPGGPERDEDVDGILLAAGIGPGDPSLYPRSAPEMFEPQMFEHGGLFERGGAG